MQNEKDVNSMSEDLLVKVREVLLNDYALAETQLERITTYSDELGGICHVRTMGEGVDIGFLKGAVFDDKYWRLRGKGKKMRVLHLTYLDSELLHHYIAEAIAANDA